MFDWPICAYQCPFFNLSALESRMCERAKSREWRDARTRREPKLPLIARYALRTPKPKALPSAIWLRIPGQADHHSGLIPIIVPE